MNHLKKVVLVGACALVLSTSQIQANVWCDFLYVCETLFNLGAGAGMAIYPGMAAAVDPTAIAPRAVGVALFIRGFRQLCSCFRGDNQDESLKKRMKESEDRNWEMQKKLGKLQRKVIEVEGKFAQVQQRSD